MSALNLLPGVNQRLPELIAIRRDIHAHPELGLEEHRTAALVAEKLKSWGIETATGIGKTGVVGTIRGRLPGQRAIALRADMDALAMTEQTGLPWASKTPGRMHGCGHDGHTTMLLGAARHLAENPGFGGTVHLIFQPAEEGRGGALAMLADGLFERFPCDAVYGMHNAPGQPAGSFAIRKGPAMAGGGSWRARFTGNGGHGGRPHIVTDLSLVLSHYILGLQSIITRDMTAFDPAVISVACIEGGSMDACNVMPSQFTVAGTMRYFDEPVKDSIDKRMRELAKHCAKLHGAGAEVELDWFAVPLVNHARQVDTAMRAAARVAGDAAVNGSAPPITGGEDFAYMLREKPGSFIFLGNGISADSSFHGVHTPQYDFNDEIIPHGVSYWVELVNQELRPAA